jgi:hypothetical protein
MRFIGQASRSHKFAILWAIDMGDKYFLDLEGYLRKLALLGPPLGILRHGRHVQESACAVCFTLPLVTEP